MNKAKSSKIGSYDSRTELWVQLLAHRIGWSKLIGSILSVLEIYDGRGAKF
jgi:hypothetical protein